MISNFHFSGVREVSGFLASENLEFIVAISFDGNDVVLEDPNFYTPDGDERTYADWEHEEEELKNLIYSAWEYETLINEYESELEDPEDLRQQFLEDERMGN